MQGRMGPGGGGSGGGGGGSSHWPDGTLALPGEHFSNDTNNGVRRVTDSTVTTDYWSLVTGGVDVLRVAKGPYFGRAAFGNFTVPEPLTNGTQDGTILISGGIFTADNNGIIAFAPSIVNNAQWGAGHVGDTAFAPDSAVIQASLYQNSATARGAGRVAAFQAIRALVKSNADTDAGTWSGVEIGIATAYTGHNFEVSGLPPKTMALWVQSCYEGTLGVSPAQMVDCGIYLSANIAADGTGGFRYPIYYRDESGVTQFSMGSTGRISLGTGGNAGAPQLTFVGDEDSGFWRIGANGIGLATAGVEALRVDGSQNFALGNVATVAGSRLLVSGGLIEAAGGIKNTGAFMLTSVISPTAISANTDDWNPTGLSTATVIRANTSGAGPFNLTGIVAQPAGRTIFFTNIGSANIVLKNNTTSTAANRFFTPSGGADFVLPTNSCCILWYDTAQSCWKVMSAAGTSG